MTKFETLKNEFIEAIKPHSPCTGEYRKVLESTNEEQLLNVILNNLSWCTGNNVINQAYFDKFDKDIFQNSGIANTGKDNTGFINSGNSNSGNSNSGYRNSGDSNSGNWNSGYSNSGDSNSGNSNSGYWNSGDSNSGNNNSGYWNSGDSNSGDSNSGYRNSGAFCTDNNPVVYLFDKKTNIKVKDWENSRPYRLMCDYLNFTIWVPFSIMTPKEKEQYPKAETCEGYLKTIAYKEGWANMWGNLSKKDKKEFTSLPNFDKKKFEEITGIKL